MGAPTIAAGLFTLGLNLFVFKNSLPATIGYTAATVILASAFE